MELNVLMALLLQFILNKDMEEIKINSYFTFKVEVGVVHLNLWKLPLKIVIQDPKVI